MRFFYQRIKNFSLRIWRIFLFFIIFINLKDTKNSNSRVFYGGSRRGHIGGPLVKVQKLRLEFPEYRNNFNLVYLLSNNSYLSKRSLNLLKTRNVPIIVNQNGVYYKAWFKGDYFARNQSMAFGYHLADYVIWQSDFCKTASNKFLGTRTGEGEILYNSVDTNLFVPKSKNKKLFTFLITGNINKENNYRIISVIKAFKELDNFYKKIHLIIAGNIDDKDFLERKTYEMKLQDKIKFIGKFNQFEAPNIYTLADAYITLTYQDNCPTAVLEAMSCGLPVLYSDSGGIPELVDNKSGVGLEVKSNWDTIETPRTKDIVEGMLKIMNNNKSMSEAARTRASEKFDIKNWLERHKVIFNLLLNSKR